MKIEDARKWLSADTANRTQGLEFRAKSASWEASLILALDDNYTYTTFREDDGSMVFHVIGTTDQLRNLVTKLSNLDD